MNNTLKRFLLPLWIFIVGQFILLGAFLFFPAIGNASTQLAADTATMAPVFWGWTWAVQGARLWVFLAIEGATLYLVVKTFIAAKDDE